jgi:hypothetical protein
VPIPQQTTIINTVSRMGLSLFMSVLHELLRLSAASLSQRDINMGMVQLGEYARCRSAWPTYGGFIDRFAAAYLARN